MIASTLLDTPESRKAGTQAGNQHEMYLNQFLDILIKLERVVPTSEANGGFRGVELGSATQQDEELEYKNWADLRAYQEKFIQHVQIFGDQ